MPNKNGSSSLHTATRVLAGVGVGAVALYGAKVLLNFFGPPLAYSMKQPDCGLDSEEYMRFLSIITGGAERTCSIVRLRNGTEFYPAELEAVRGAMRAVNLEFYEFSEGEVSARLMDALLERAAAGVEVRLIVDWAGSFQTSSTYFDRLRAGGVKMQWYHPLRWDSWQHLNNRTHRKLLIVDGEVGFIGGAGIADHWLHATPAGPAWRDTVFRVTGAAVDGLLSTFSENWLRCSGEILSGPRQFERKTGDGDTSGFVVSSTPHGGGTGARILFQALINSARRSIRITTPYFLPDRSAKQALIGAVQQRGVSVEILTAGPKIDHALVRNLSMRGSRHLLQGGATIWEYQPSMIHAKLMTIDSEWCVLGSTNFDHRSFALNDEVNLAVRDPVLARVIEADFADDLTRSERLTLEKIRKNTIGRLGQTLSHALKQEG